MHEQRDYVLSHQDRTRGWQNPISSEAGRAHHTSKPGLALSRYGGGNVVSLGHTHLSVRCLSYPGCTLCREKVLTQKVASSMVSSRVTWMKP